MTDIELSDVSVGEVHNTEPDRIIRRNHYLKSSPGPPTRHRYLITGGIMHGPIGAAIWGRPASRELNQETTIELRRFWTADCAPKNCESKVLGEMLRDMDSKGYHRCIAYASVAHHEGTIYKATNWTSLGLRWPASWDNRDREQRDSGVKMLFEYVFEDGWYTTDNQRLSVQA